MTARTDMAPIGPGGRLPLVDAARGGALAAMIVYHFAWDLSFYDLIATEIATSRPWQIFARAIAGSFLALVGVSLVLATRGGLRPRPYLRRLALVTGAALAITAVTRIALPDDFIWFGILHCIAVSSVLGLAFLRLPVSIVIVAAALALAAPGLFAHPAFDAPAWRWLGLMTYFPRTNDYVPLLPWFGMVLAGIALARLVLARAAGASFLRWHPSGRIGRTLVWTGRRSLAVYLVHQPLLLAALYGVAAVAGPSPAAVTREFLTACERTCVATGSDTSRCQVYCACIADRLKEDGLWDSVIANRVTPSGQDALTRITRDCDGQDLP